MVFESVLSSQIEAGKATTKDLFSKIKENEDDLNTRLNTLEGAAGESGAITIVNASLHTHNFFSSLQAVARYQAREEINLTAVIVSRVGTPSLLNSDKLEIDILKSSTINGTYSTIMTTKPSLLASSSAASSTNGVFSNNVLANGDWVRVDITSMIPSISEVHILLRGEVV